jgi:histidinol-phosphatase (PHP family)
MAGAPLLYDTHIHTPLCRHARGEPEEFAEVAASRGLAGIVVTCHNPMPDGFSADTRMSAEEMPEYLAMVDRARAAMAGRADVRLGVESDYYPGVEGFLENQLRSAPFEYVLGSVHPIVRDYIDLFSRGSALDLQRTYFEHLAMAAETRLFDALSHPDIIKIVTPDEWDLDRIRGDIERCLDRVAKTGTAMELNTSGVIKDAYPEMNPGPGILLAMRERGIPAVIGSDAHEPHRAGEGFREALALLQEAGYEKTSFFLKRERRDIDIDAAMESLIEV